MTAPVFLVPADRLAGDVVVLDGPEGRHAASVRRLSAGERIDLTDGAGTVVEATVQERGRDLLRCAVLSRRFEPPAQPRLTVAQALVADHAEDAVAAMTEVGVDVFVPWAAERSVVRWSGDRVERGLRRWRAAAREAAKQSRRAWLPEVRDPVDLDALAAIVTAADAAVLLHEGAQGPLAAVEIPQQGEVLIVIGPEGGCADGEVARLAAAGAHVCRLGPSILRSTTAGVAAAAVLLAATRWR